MGLPANVELVTEEFDLADLPESERPWTDNNLDNLRGLTAEALDSKARSVTPLLALKGWQLAFIVHAMDDTEKLNVVGLQVRGKPYESVTEWGEDRLHRSSGTISKLRQAAAAVIALPERDRLRAMRTQPQQLSETGAHRLLKSDPDKALEIAESGMSQEEMKQAVRQARAADPDQHFEPGHAQRKTLYLGETARRYVDRLEAVTKFRMTSPNPSESEVWECIGKEAVDDSLAQIEPEIRALVGDELILSGRVRCHTCAITGIQNLVAKDGTDGPIFYCHAHGR